MTTLRITEAEVRAVLATPAVVLPDREHFDRRIYVGGVIRVVVAEASTVAPVQVVVTVGLHCTVAYEHGRHTRSNRPGRRPQPQPSLPYNAA